MPSKVAFKVARTHGDSLLAVCACCWLKPGSLRPVGSVLCDLIRKFRYQEYDTTSEIHPKVICDSCRWALTELGKDPENSSRELPPNPEYESLSVGTGPVTRTRSDTKCSCPICLIGRMNGLQYKEYEKVHSCKRGRKKTPPNLATMPKVPQFDWQGC